MAASLTKRQSEVLDYIQACVAESGMPPTSREIQEHFGFASQTAAMDHLRALERKGALKRLPGKARALVVLPESKADGRGAMSSGGRVRRIPLYGHIAAGMPSESIQMPEESVAVDAALLGLPARGRDVFGLRVVGDSMTDAHIMNGDIVVLEVRPPRVGDIVAALIDGESTLKRYIVRDGTPFLKAENPAYPELTPAAELTIQGVMVGLLRGTL